MSKILFAINLEIYLIFISELFFNRHVLFTVLADCKSSGFWKCLL